MTGAIDAGGAFSVSNTYPGGVGGCDETYTLQGQRIGEDEFRGTFTAEYDGPTCAAGGCVTQPAWEVRGLR
jgi:hypothetical protein